MEVQTLTRAEAIFPSPQQKRPVMADAGHMAAMLASHVGPNTPAAHMLTHMQSATATTAPTGRTWSWKQPTPSAPAKEHKPHISYTTQHPQGATLPHKPSPLPAALRPPSPVYTHACAQQHASPICPSSSPTHTHLCLAPQQHPPTQPTQPPTPTPAAAAPGAPPPGAR